VFIWFCRRLFLLAFKPGHSMSSLEAKGRGIMNILITGANRGIGLEFVRQYAAAGEAVHAGCRNPGEAKDLQALAARYAGVKIHALDVTDQASVDGLAFALKDIPVNLLINNAGVYGGTLGETPQDLEGMDYGMWADVFAINTMAPLRVIQAVLPNLKAAGRGAKIVTISSRMGAMSDARPGSYAYRSSKAAVNKIMQLVAMDLAQYGIIACPFHPGWVRTDMGGTGADISVEESVSGLRATIAGLTQKDSGRFWQWNGQTLDW
jgi:NAD(P)-dependent dehydrogenase (short-subunit alcohol dehydrogenase family)